MDPEGAGAAVRVRILPSETKSGSSRLDLCQYVGSELDGGCRAGEEVLTAGMEVAEALLDGPVSQGAGTGQQVSLTSDVSSVLIYLSTCFA